MCEILWVRKLLSEECFEYVRILTVYLSAGAFWVAPSFLQSWHVTVEQVDGLCQKQVAQNEGAQTAQTQLLYWQQGKTDTESLSRWEEETTEHNTKATKLLTWIKWVGIHVFQHVILWVSSGDTRVPSSEDVWKGINEKVLVKVILSVHSSLTLEAESVIESYSFNFTYVGDKEVTYIFNFTYLGDKEVWSPPCRKAVAES